MINKCFSGNSNSLGSRDLRSFFSLRIWRQSFLLTNLTIVLFFSFKQWQAWTSCSSISTPIFNTNQDTTHRFLKETITNWVWNANNLQGVSSGILCVFPAWSFLFDNPLYKSIVNSLNDSNICFQLFKISQSVFNFLW